MTVIAYRNINIKIVKRGNEYEEWFCAYIDNYSVFGDMDEDKIIDKVTTKAFPGGHAFTAKWGIDTAHFGMSKATADDCVEFMKAVVDECYKNMKN